MKKVPDMCKGKTPVYRLILTGSFTNKLEIYSTIRAEFVQKVHSMFAYFINGEINASSQGIPGR
jgi:hypothetical protein